MAVDRRIPPAKKGSGHRCDLPNPMTHAVAGELARCADCRAWSFVGVDGDGYQQWYRVTSFHFEMRRRIRDLARS